MSVALIILLSLIMLTRTTSYKIQKSILMLVVSLGFALYAVEFTMFLYDKFETSPARVAEPRTKKEYIESLNRGRSIELAVPSIPPSSLLFDESSVELLPLSGISDVVTVHCNEGGFWMTYLSDEHGFNNPRGLYGTGKVEVVLIGDSFTQGNCVAEGDDIAGVMRSTRPRKTDSHYIVVNLGYGGNGPFLSYATLREYATHLKPHYVVWLFLEDNDVLDAIKESELDIVRQYLGKPNYYQDLISRQSVVDELLYNKIEQRTDSGRTSIKFITLLKDLINPLKLARVRTLMGIYLIPEKKIIPEFVVQILKRAKDDVRAWGGELIVIYIPLPANYVLKNWHPQYDKYELFQSLTEKGIHYGDFSTVLDNIDDPASLYPFRRHGHFNKNGYALLAEFIESNLQSLKQKH